MSQFLELKRREISNFQDAAVATAKEALSKAIRTSEDLNWGAVASRIRSKVGFAPRRTGARADSTATRAKVAAQPQLVDRSITPNNAKDRNVQPRDGLTWLDRSIMAKAIGGDLARRAGIGPGIGRGALHSVEGLVDTADLIVRLANPALDTLISPPGQSAIAQLVGGSFNSGKTAVNYVKKGIANPQGVVQDVRNKAHKIRVDLDPAATPMAQTFGGELKRNYDIGQNQGELTFNVGSLVAGGPLARGLGAAADATRASSTAKFLSQGFEQSQAAYLAGPYKRGMGAHFVPRRYQFPNWLGGGQLPKSFMDGPFNVLDPEGISRGDLYELHYLTDRKFHGTKIPASAGGGVWSGGALGLQKYDPIRAFWHGMPGPLKVRIGGFTSGTGGLLYQDDNQEEH